MFFKNKVINRNSGPLAKTVCNCCGYVARDKDDMDCIAVEGTCTDCRDNFKTAMLELWKKNQRPTREVARKRMNILIDEVWHEKPRSNT